MKRMIRRIGCLVALVAMSSLPASAAAPSLTVGSKAPPIDIEHWVQDGNGQFEHVTEFKDGKVYVVEFWATWCGPCIMSMPKLADLQNKYRDKEVQVISISDEKLTDVKALLPQDHPVAKKTFAEITSAYSLTTDPDRSVHVDYMEAAGRNGIPCAFVVGKTGLVEWIGHPMEMEGPLEEVIEDKWDREVFKKELLRDQEFQASMQELSQLANSGKFEEAIKLADVQLEKTADDQEINERWLSIRYSLMLSAGKIDDEVLAFYRNELVKMKGDVGAVGQFSYSLYGLHQQGAEVGVLAKDAVKALTAEVEGAPKEFLPLVHNTLAQLHSINSEFDKAIAAQEKAIEVAQDERQKKRLGMFLEDLKSMKEKAASKDEK